MLNRFAKMAPRLARAFAAACVFALLAACGAETEPESAPTEPAPSVSYSVAAQGATTPEELAFRSDVVARVRLLSAAAGVRKYPTGDGIAPRPVFVFRFRVIEYLKGSGDDELTVRVLAIDTSSRSHYFQSASPTPDASAALQTAKARLAERDTRWDGLEAIVFLSPSPLANESGVYEFTTRRSTVGLHNYAITSDNSNSYVPNRAWLPGGAPSGKATADTVTA